MKSLAFSCLICPLNPYFKQKVLRKGKNTRGCPKLKKLLKSCQAQSGQAQGRGGGRGEVVGRRAQIYESALFFVRALVHDAVVVPNFLSRFLGNPGKEEVSETP